MNEADGASKRPALLLVDDDETFCRVLGAALDRRGFQVAIANNPDEVRQEALRVQPAFAVVDLRLTNASGLEVVATLHELDDRTRIVVLTGYASISTAVEAIKLGATHYLTKPADADEIVAAFERSEGDPGTPMVAEPLSVQQLESEHLEKVLSDCDGNITQAARKLHMHRRTLQRKLSRLRRIEDQS